MSESPSVLECAPQAAPRPVSKAKFLLFVALLAAANIIWAGQLTAVNFMKPLGPLAVAFLPFLFITPLLLPLLIWNRSRKSDAPRPGARDWFSFIIAGGLGQVVAQFGMTLGSIRGQASACSILYLMIPVITAVLASLMLGEEITVLRIGALAVGLAGAVLMSIPSLTSAGAGQTGQMIGNVLMLIGCFGASFYNVYCKGLMQKFHERDILIYSYITATPIGLTIMFFYEPDAFRLLTHLSASGWGAFVFNVLFVYGVSMLMLFYVLQYLPVTVVLASTYLTPVFGVIIAMLFLHEKLSPVAMIGAVIVLAATVLIMKYDAAPE